MTTSAECNQIGETVVKLITIDMMHISFSNCMTNLTNILTRFLCVSFKKSKPVNIARRIFAFCKSVEASFATKSTPTILHPRFVFYKLISTVFTGKFYFSSVKSAFVRAIFTGRMLQTRLMFLKDLPASFACKINFRNFQSFDRAISRAKTLLLVQDSVLSNLKWLFTNSTNQINSVLPVFVLTNSRTKKVFVFFHLIRKRLEECFALGTRYFHSKYHIRRSAIRTTKVCCLKLNPNQGA